MEEAKDGALCASCPYKRICAQLNEILGIQEKTKAALSSDNMGLFRELNEELTEKMTQAQNMSYCIPKTENNGQSRDLAAEGLWLVHQACLERTFKTVYSKNQEQEILIHDLMSSVSREIQSVMELRSKAVNYKMQIRKRSFFDSIF